MSELPSATSHALPDLVYLGSGSQNHVFGTREYALRVRRWSLLSTLAAVIRSPRWQGMARESLGGCILPFSELQGVAFTAPILEASPLRRPVRPVAGTRQIYRARRALAHPRVPREAFLDHLYYRADAPEAIRLLREMLDLLDEVACRGFHLFDFIMGNFVEFGGRLVIADPEFVVPRHLVRRSPSLAVTARQFRIHLARDYDLLLANKQDCAQPGDARDVATFRAEFGQRVSALARRPPGRSADGGYPARLPDAIARAVARTFPAAAPLS
ncbi:hypothetical protein BH23VER1_BH23VER1_16640 [soil metagenome]